MRGRDPAGPQHNDTRTLGPDNHRGTYLTLAPALGGKDFEGVAG